MINDNVLTATLIENQIKKNSITADFKLEMEETLRPLSRKLDLIIERLQKLMQCPPKKIEEVLFVKKINDQYQQLRLEWNMYIKKIFLVLQKIAKGNIVLEGEADDFYLEMYL